MSFVSQKLSSENVFGKTVFFVTNMGQNCSCRIILPYKMSIFRVFGPCARIHNHEKCTKGGWYPRLFTWRLSFNSSGIEIQAISGEMIENVKIWENEPGAASAQGRKSKFWHNTSNEWLRKVPKFHGDSASGFLVGTHQKNHRWGPIRPLPPPTSKAPSSYIFLVSTWSDFSEGLFVVGEAPSNFTFPVNTFAIGGRRTIAN